MPKKRERTASASPHSPRASLFHDAETKIVVKAFAGGLARHGVNTIGQLIARSRQDLKNEIHGLGIGSISDIEEA